MPFFLFQSLPKQVPLFIFGNERVLRGSRLSGVVFQPQGIKLFLFGGIQQVNCLVANHDPWHFDFIWLLCNSIFYLCVRWQIVQIFIFFEAFEVLSSLSILRLLLLFYRIIGGVSTIRRIQGVLLILLFHAFISLSHCLLFVDFFLL